MFTQLAGYSIKAISSSHVNISLSLEDLSQSSVPIWLNLNVNCSKYTVVVVIFGIARFQHGEDRASTK